MCVSGGSGGDRVGVILNCGPLDSDFGYGFSLWFGVFGKTGNRRFPDATHTLTFDCAIFKRRGEFYEIRDSPAPLFTDGLPSFVMFSIPHFAKPAGDRNDCHGWARFGPLFFAFLMGGRDMTNSWGVSGTVYAYGLP